MKRIVEYTIKNSKNETVVIPVEAEDVDLPKGYSQSSRVDVSSEANLKFEDAIERVKLTAIAIFEKLKGVSDPPPDIEVEFGLKLTANAGAVVASVGAEAQYKLTLKWPH